MKPTILIVEDDKAVQRLMAAAMDNAGYHQQIAADGQAAVTLALSLQPQVIVLDLGLPDWDGVEVIRKLRSWSETPIIVVSARGDDRDKIEALDAGADDYLTKPFSVDELLARIRVALRKARYDQSGAAGEAVFTNGQLSIDYAAGCVYRDGTELHLTPIEYKLLCLLAKNVGKVLTHQYILKTIWGTVMESDMRSLRVFMAALRKKIEPDPTQPIYIQTHVGIGYRMLRIENE